MTARHPVVFISYSWDSEDHRDWVLGLATKLVQGGVDVRLDQWHVRPGDSFTQFMEIAIADADRVLMVLTPAYARKANARQGGVGYEQHIISSEVFDGARGKFLPILREGTFQSGAQLALPTHLRGVAGIDMRQVADFDCAFRQLLRAVHGLHLSPPPLGPVPYLDDDARSVVIAARSAEERENAAALSRGNRETIWLSQDLSPAGGRLALEIACQDTLKQKQGGGELVHPSVFVDQYTPLRRVLKSIVDIDAHTEEQKRARSELEKAIAYQAPWGIPLDTVLEEVSAVVLTHLSAGSTPWVYNSADAAEVLEWSYRQFSPSSIFVTGTKVDVYRVDHSAYYSIRLTKDEEAHVLHSTGYGETKYLALGFTFDDLPTDILRPKLLPALVHEYVRLKHMETAPPSAETFFARDGWALGLG